MIKELQEKCEQLRIEMGIMRQSIDILDGENTELGEEVKQLKAENERLRGEIK